jgi:hypothetical protein
MKKIAPFLMTSALIFVILFLDRLGVFKSPAAGVAILFLIIFGVLISYKIKEYIKDKYPNTFPLKKCPDCGSEIPEDSYHCPNCEKVIDHQITIDDKFAEDMKEKKICPSCGQKELETIYIVSKGYKEVCASCGKTRVSRRAVKMSLVVLCFFIALMLYFYWLFQMSLR